MANEAIIDMVATKLSEVIIAKIQTSKTDFNLRTPALVELNNSGVSANVPKEMTTRKTLRHVAGVTSL